MDIDPDDIPDIGGEPDHVHGGGDFIPPPGSVPEGAAGGALALQKAPSQPAQASAEADEGETHAAPAKAAAKGKPSGQKRGLFNTLTLSLLSLSLITLTAIGSMYLMSLGKEAGSTRIFFGTGHGANALTMVRNAVQAAKSEVIIVASHMNSVPLLDLLLTKSEEVNVVIVLDASNPKTSDVYKYLTERGLPRQRIVLHGPKLSTQTVIIDQRYVLQGTTPFNSDAVNMISDLRVEDHPALAKQFRDQIFTHLTSLLQAGS